MTIRYLQINKGLYLIEQPIDVPAGGMQPHEAVNHIWIYDRSGSMYSQIKQLCEDLKEKIKKIPLGDTLTIGWFSSENRNFNWIFKGWAISTPGDRDLVEKAIDKNNTTIALTCFSEILEDSSVVIEDLSVISGLFSLCFFTDGYPVVSNLESEINRILKALINIETRLVNCIMVGYGDYYNKDLLAKMAARAGGQLIHASDLKTFSLNLDRLIEESRQSDGKIVVNPVVQSAVAYFSILGSGVILYDPLLKDSAPCEIKFSVPDDLQAYLYAIAPSVPDGAQEVDFFNCSGRFLKAGYAAASVLVNKTMTDVAVDLLGKLGDKHVIDLVTNAYTNAEYGRAEVEIVSAAFDTKQRLKEGYRANYVPAPDAFCLLDLLDLLLADDEAFFYPTHPRFEYKRIGVPARPLPGYPKFVPDDLARSPVSSLTWNDTKLNLSVQAKINGKIALRDGHEALGFNRHYPTFQYRNYAIVKDGFLNVQVLPCSMNRGTYEALLRHQVIDDKYPNWVQGFTYLMHLDRIPIINRAIAEGKNSATELFVNTHTELQLQGIIKALKFLRNEIDPEGDKLKTTTLSPEQERFLEEHGIGKSGFAPPVEKVAPTDKYFAKEFIIKAKGFSSLPKVDAVREKMRQGKELKPAEELVAVGLRTFVGQPIETMSEAVQLQFLDDQIKHSKGLLHKVRSDIQRTKFAVILAKKWFTEFSSREGCHLDIGGVDYSLEVREVEVPI